MYVTNTKCRLEKITQPYDITYLTQPAYLYIYL